MKRVLLGARRFNFDFAGAKLSLGEEGFLSLLDDLALVKEVRRIRSVYADFQDTTTRLRKLAHSRYLSLTTLERKEKQIMSSELSKLIKPKPSFQSKSMCLLTRAYVVSKLSYPNPPSNNMLRYSLYEIAGQKGAEICVNCCYREGSKSRDAMPEYERLECPVCHAPGNGLIVPKTKDVFNRFVRSIDQQQLEMAQKGRHYWEDKYQHTCVRDKPDAINKVWFADHHVFDITVACKKQKGEYIFGRPWLTAVFDAASDVLVGWVISVRPNKNTIAESFCRAAAFTLDSDVHGLCEVFYCDRGKDYKSNLIEGRDFNLRQRIDTSMYLNRAFFDNPLLPALNVTVQHARAYSGRSKPCERIFGTFERRYISQLPGWIGCSAEARPYDFSKEMKRLKKIDGFLTIEDFARLWDEVILPDYHNNPYDNDTSPMERYRTLPKADTLTPDWNTLAVFKKEKPPHKVHQNGVHYNKDIYWNRALEPYVDKYVLVYDFDETFYHNISILYEDKFICEAKPAIHYNTIETDKLKLRQHLAAQQSQRKKLTRHISKVRYRLKASDVKINRYADTTLAPVDAENLEEEEFFCYTSSIDFERNEQEATVISSDASALAKIHQQRLHEIERLLTLSEDDPVDDYYAELGKAMKAQNNNKQN